MYYFYIKYLKKKTLKNPPKQSVRMPIEQLSTVQWFIYRTKHENQNNFLM